MTDEAMAQVAIRLPQDLLDRADRLAERMAKDPLTRGVKRSDVLRAAIEAGLATLERKAKRR